MDRHRHKRKKRKYSKQELFQSLETAEETDVKSTPQQRKKPKAASRAVEEIPTIPETIIEDEESRAGSDVRAGKKKGKGKKAKGPEAYITNKIYYYTLEAKEKAEETMREEVEKDPDRDFPARKSRGMKARRALTRFDDKSLLTKEEHEEDKLLQLLQSLETAEETDVKPTWQQRKKPKAASRAVEEIPTIPETIIEDEESRAGSYVRAGKKKGKGKKAKEPMSMEAAVITVKTGVVSEKSSTNLNASVRKRIKKKMSKAKEKAEETMREEVEKDPDRDFSARKSRGMRARSALTRFDDKSLLTKEEHEEDKLSQLLQSLETAEETDVKPATRQQRKKSKAASRAVEEIPTIPETIIEDEENRAGSDVRAGKKKGKGKKAKEPMSMEAAVITVKTGVVSEKPSTNLNASVQKRIKKKMSKAKEKAEETMREEVEKDPDRDFSARKSRGMRARSSLTRFDDKSLLTNKEEHEEDKLLQLFQSLEPAEETDVKPTRQQRKKPKATSRAVEEIPTIPETIIEDEESRAGSDVRAGKKKGKGKKAKEPMSMEAAVITVKTGVVSEKSSTNVNTSVRERIEKKMSKAKEKAEKKMREVEKDPDRDFPTRKLRGMRARSALTRFDDISLLTKEEHEEDKLSQLFQSLEPAEETDVKPTSQQRKKPKAASRAVEEIPTIPETIIEDEENRAGSDVRAGKKKGKGKKAKEPMSMEAAVITVKTGVVSEKSSTNVNTSVRERIEKKMSKAKEKAEKKMREVEKDPDRDFPTRKSRGMRARSALTRFDDMSLLTKEEHEEDKLLQESLAAKRKRKAAFKAVKAKKTHLPTNKEANDFVTRNFDPEPGEEKRPKPEEEEVPDEDQPGPSSPREEQDSKYHIVRSSKIIREVPSIPTVTFAGISNLTDLLTELPLPSPLPSTVNNKGLLFSPCVAEEAKRLIGGQDENLIPQLLQALSLTNTDNIELKDESSGNEIEGDVPALLQAILARNPNVFKQKRLEQTGGSVNRYTGHQFSPSAAATGSPGTHPTMGSPQPRNREHSQPSNGNTTSPFVGSVNSYTGHQFSPAAAATGSPGTQPTMGSPQPRNRAHSQPPSGNTTSPFVGSVNSYTGHQFSPAAAATGIPGTHPTMGSPQPRNRAHSQPPNGNTTSPFVGSVNSYTGHQFSPAAAATGIPGTQPTMGSPQPRNREHSQPPSGNTSNATKERIHTKVKPCQHCTKNFSQAGKKTVHERIHPQENPYQCNYCSKSFVSSSTNTKGKGSHTKKKPFQCSYCTKSFPRVDNKTRHERVHTKEKPYLCKYCKKSFSQVGHKTEHERIHTKEKPYSCDFCTKCFSHSSSKTEHERTIHATDKPFRCKYCTKGFTMASDKTEHEKSNHTYLITWLKSRRGV